MRGTLAFSHSLYLSTICVIVGRVHLDVAYGLNTPYRLWLAAAGTSTTVTIEMFGSNVWIKCLDQMAGTVGIQLSDMFGNQMAKSSPIAEWSVN